ncbi:MAG: hypothetical protein ACOX3T_07565 [Bdellovibrionota bacterium]
MKKGTIIIISIILLIVGIYWYAKDSSKDAKPQKAASVESTQTTTLNDAQEESAREAQEESDEDSEDITDDEGELDIRPAVDVYSSADEALKAVRKAAINYDDIVIEQFYMLGNCSWCEKFYTDITNLTLDKRISSDERTYYAEILGTSGRKENIETLVYAATNSENETEKDIFTEALELSNLSNESLNYLKEEYKNFYDEELKIATIAAISNQGTKDSIEILYEMTKESNDPKGFYDDGVGLGEVVPEDAAFPLLDEIASKRDNYSHLAIKALLNGGLEGTKRVIDILANGKNSKDDIKKLDLENAADHVLYDDETKSFLQSVQNPNEAQEFFIDEIIRVSAESKNDE